MNENKAKVWLARDKNGELWLYTSIPYRDDCEWFCKEPCCKIDSSNFPSVSCEDSKATEAYITLAEPQEQPKQEQPKPKQEIDWEQRRYEIAKEMMPVLYRQGVEVLKYGQSFEWKEIVDGAVNFADMLIEKLKKGGEL